MFQLIDNQEIPLSLDDFIRAKFKESNNLLNRHTFSIDVIYLGRC